MAIIGRFIGVDRYQDPAIRDLTGAKNDALALWALFKDTLPMESEIITGLNATVTNIQKALGEGLVIGLGEFQHLKLRIHLNQ